MIPEQPIDTRFPGQQFPVGSVVTFLDRDRRTVFPAGTELRRHEAIVAGGEAGRWRVRYAGLRLIKAGPTGGATMREVGDHAAQLLVRHLNTNALATRWPLPLRDRHGPLRHLPARHQDHRAVGQLPACRERLGTTSETHSFARSHTRSSDPATDTTPCGRPPRGASAARQRCSIVTHSLKRWIGECPRCRDRWFRHRLTAKLRQRSNLPAAGLARHLEKSTPTGKAADRGNARTGLPRLPVRSDDRPDGHRHRQTTVRGPASPPRAGGSFGPPSHPS